MSIEKSLMLLMCTIFAISLYTGCKQNKIDNIDRKALDKTEEKNITSKQQRNVPQEIKENANRSRPKGRENEFTTEGQRAAVDSCSEAFNKCRRKCVSYSCEDRCNNELSACQADECSVRFNACIGQCKSSSCEDRCNNELSYCEKDLPSDLKQSESFMRH
jgi:hypothetical protein